MDLVSVIIPVYNVENFLDRCISSVVGQTFYNLEIILIDDGSPDKCPEICDTWAKKDSRIVVLHQLNRGLSAARNSGLKIASGSYIMLLDSDDYIAPFAVELLLEAAKQTKSDMAICGFVKGSEENYSFREKELGTVETINNETALFRIYSDNTSAMKYGAAWGKLCNRFLYDSIFFPEGKIFEDIYTTHKLLYRCNQIAVLDTPLIYYFQRPDSIMNTKFNLQKLDYLQALVERLDFFAAHNLEELESIAYDELLHSLIWEYSRTRDMLNNKEGMKYVASLFRQVYEKGYASRRYPKETARFLAVFNKNPEWIILYWKISGKLNGIIKRNG